MAQGMEGWRSYSEHVRGGLPDNNYVSAKHILMMSGPPFLNMLGSGQVDSQTVVFPIALAQGFNLGMNKSTMRLFEIGSTRSYPFSGRAVGQASLSAPLYHGPSLLRSLYAYYDTTGDTAADAFQVRGLIPTTNNIGVNPFSSVRGANGLATRKGGLNSIRIPPGYDNLFSNLASDLFDQSTGMFFLMKDNELSNYAAFYMESCLVPNHSIGWDANGLLVQESLSIQFERLMPVQLNQIGLVETYNATDETGGYSGPRIV